MSENDPTFMSKCCCCMQTLSLKCFLMSCKHFMCDKCSTKQNHVYACEIDNKEVNAETLAFYDESINKVTMIYESMAFSLHGTCGRCNQAALVDIKQCGHKMCKSCAERLVESNEKRESRNIRCGEDHCQTKVPIVLVEGILGKLPIELPQIRMVHRIMSSFHVVCANKVDEQNGTLCSNESDIYVPSCSLNVCYICLIKHIYETHKPIYVEKNLLDVVPCMSDNCTTLYLVNAIQQLESDRKLEEEKNVMILLDTRASDSSCQFPNCTVKARILFSCGHSFCRLCYVDYNPEIEVIVRGKKTCYCICYVCSKRTKQSIGNQQVSIDENDFLKKPKYRCEFGHKEALVSTFCCDLSFCQDCLQGKLSETGITSNLFGVEFNDVLKCKSTCRGGVPKQMILQFLQKYSGGSNAPIKDACTKLQTPQPKEKDKKQTGNSLNPKSSTVPDKPKFKSTLNLRITEKNELAMTYSYETSNYQYDESLDITADSSEMLTDGKSSKKRADYRANGKGMCNVSKESTDEIHSAQSMETGDTNNLQNTDTDETHCFKKKKAATLQEDMPSDQTITEQAMTATGIDTTLIEGLFGGLTQLCPVKGSLVCINCQNKANVQLNCNHAFCFDCLCLLEKCSACTEYIPRWETYQLMERLKKITLHQTASDASSHETETGQTHTSKFNQETVHQHTSVKEIKGVNNMGMTCYANSIFQILGQTRQFVDKISETYITAESVGKRVLLTHDLMVFLHQLTNTGDNSTVDKSILIPLLQRIVSIDTTFERYQQNDCFEFLMCILERLKFENEELTSMFEITMKTVFKFKPCQHVQYGNEQLSHSLLIPISKDKNSSYSVNAGLNGLLSSSEKFGKGVLPCKDCNIPGQTKETKQSLQLTIAPPILIVQIGRVRKQGYFRSYAKKENVLVRYDEEIEVPGTIQDERKITRQIYKYKLYGVVLHSGSIDSGHYYSYVKKLQTDRWFLCNDSLVKPMRTENVFENRNAYLLFYEKIDEKQLQTTM